MGRGEAGSGTFAVSSLSGGRGRSGVRFGDRQPVACFEIALAAEPVFHGGLEAVQGDAVPCFEEAVGGGEGVVKDGVVGEVAHGEVIDPVDGAGVMPALAIDSFDGQLAREHDAQCIERLS